MLTGKRVAQLLGGCATIIALGLGSASSSSVAPGTFPSARRALVSQLQHIPVIPPPAPSNLEAFRSKIQHIIFIIKENRSFDTYFGTFPGADGATSGVISTGERMALKHAKDRRPRDMGPAWE